MVRLVGFHGVSELGGGMLVVVFAGEYIHGVTVDFVYKPVFVGDST